MAKDSGKRQWQRTVAKAVAKNSGKGQWQRTVTRQLLRQCIGPGHVDLAAELAPLHSPLQVAGFKNIIRKGVSLWQNGSGSASKDTSRL